MKAAPVFRLLCALILVLPAARHLPAEGSLPRAGGLAHGPAFETLAAPGDSGGELHTIDPAHESDVLAVTGPFPGIAPEVTSALLAGVLDAHQDAGLLVTEPRRGPPPRGRETHIGAFEHPGASLIGAEAFSNPHAQRGRGDSWLEIAEGEHPAVWVHNATVFSGKWVDPVGHGVTGVIKTLVSKAHAARIAKRQMGKVALETRNVATALLTVNGRNKVVARFSKQFRQGGRRVTVHSEERLILLVDRLRRRYGDENVLLHAVFSERIPCVVTANCSAKLAGFAPGVPIYWATTQHGTGAMSVLKALYKSIGN